MKNKKTLFLSVIFFIWGVTSVAYGMPILSGSSSDGWSWTASDALGRNASANFWIDGNILNLLLTNTAQETSQPNEVLAGLFFDFTGALTNPHVEVATGSIVGGKVTGTAGFNLDGEYGYLTGINAINGGLGNYGISSTAFDPGNGAPAGWTGFGTSTVINPSLSYKPPSPDGAEFGLVGSNINNLVTSINPYVQSSVLMSWNFDNSGGNYTVRNPNFLYGTDFEATPVPEPASMLLLGSGMIGLAAWGRRKFQKNYLPQ
jgi:hypothetical protein